MKNIITVFLLSVFALGMADRAMRAQTASGDSPKSTNERRKLDVAKPDPVVREAAFDAGGVVIVDANVGDLRVRPAARDHGTQLRRCGGRASLDP
jgi:hypothetical protein